MVMPGSASFAPRASFISWTNFSRSGLNTPATEGYALATLPATSRDLASSTSEA